MLPRRWHLYIVDLKPRVGTKPGNQRPCLAIQPSEFGEAGLQSTVVLPLTTKIAQEDAFPLRVRIPKGTCGLERDSELLVEQILAMKPPDASRAGLARNCYILRFEHSGQGIQFIIDCPK